MTAERYWRVRDRALEEVAQKCESALNYLLRVKKEGTTIESRTEAYHQSKCVQALLNQIRCMKVGDG